MQKKIKNHKTLIAAIGVAMLGTANAQATNSFSKRASVWPGVANTVSVTKVLDSIVQQEPAKYVKEGIAVSGHASIVTIKAVSQYDVKSVEAGWLIGASGDDSPLPAQADRYDDVLNVAADHGAAAGEVDSLAKLGSFYFGAVSANAMSAKVPANENPAASPVPLPAAAWSFLIGLLGILGLKKRKSPPSETS